MGCRRSAVTLLLALLLALAQAGRNFYDVLQVSKTADDASIKRSYRKLAVQYHPDKNPGDEAATARFAEINNAYEVLSDPEKRRIYDRHGEEGVRQAAANNNAGGGGGHDIFSQFFGGGFGGFGGFGGGGEAEPETPKGRPVVIDLQVTLRDLYLGNTFEVVRDKGVYKTTKGTRKCNCKTRMSTRQIAPGMYQQFPTQTCDDCPAVKLVRQRETLQVEVEPGMRDGHEIVFFEQGEPVLDGEPGDLKFRIVTVATPPPPGGRAAAGGGGGGGGSGGDEAPLPPPVRLSAFERRGDDLHLSAEVTLVDALVGFARGVTHLDGRQVALRAEGVTRPGEVVRLRGQGMPVHNAHNRFGDLVVNYSVQMPARLTEDQKDVVRELFRNSF